MTKLERQLMTHLTNTRCAANIFKFLATLNFDKEAVSSTNNRNYRNGGKNKK